MNKLLPSPYQLKKALMYPRTLYMRRKFRDINESLRTMLELHYYSPGIVNFLGATVMNPHILHEADIDGNSMVLDVGAFTGQWARKIVERYDPVIYAFEPNPQSFARLEEKAADNPKLKPFKYGLGDREQAVDFTLKGLGSSVYDERAENAEVPRIKVRIAAIEQVWEELGLAEVDLMKINIEGAEFPLLERMIEKDMLARVKCFMIQFHEWHPGAHGRRRRILEALARTHRREWNYDFVWEKWVRQ
ncbi:MAG: FkbM family methyltransferase [Halioglobus sp.]|nr:FkbM family methyltransferase [Halioglobus sp.]